MTKTLQRIGNSKGLVLTRTMLEHLGVTDAVEIQMEQGRIIITAATERAPGRRMSFDEAKAATFEKYGDALKRLSEPEQ